MQHNTDISVYCLCVSYKCAIVLVCKPHTGNNTTVYSSEVQQPMRPIRKVCSLSQLQANSKIMSYHFITEDPGTYMWISSLSVVSDGYYHTTTTI